jgi:hypothetical protein
LSDDAVVIHDLLAFDETHGALISSHPSVRMIHRRPLLVTEEIIEIALVNFKGADLFLGPPRNLPRERCNERRCKKHSSETNKKLMANPLTNRQLAPPARWAAQSGAQNFEPSTDGPRTRQKNFTSWGVTQHRRRRVQRFGDDC